MLEHVMKRSTREKLIENVAAISGEFHTSDGYRAFYDACAARQMGFPEIWSYAGQLGEAFTRAEVELVAEWVDGWIESIDGFVAEAVSAGTMWLAEEMLEHAKRHILEHLPEEGRRKPKVQRCDLCRKPYDGPHVDPVSNKPRHPGCIPY
jgi:hypothetical protein